MQARVSWGPTLWPIVLVLALAACDDGGSSTPAADTGPGADSGGQGGEGGQGGAGGLGDMGGVGGMGGGMGGADAGPACDCGGRDLTCDEATGTCLEVSPCDRDLQCLAGRVCTEGACADGCADDTACAATPEAPTCIDGRCGNCREAADCGQGQACNAAHVCVAPDRCEATSACLPGDVCADGNCADGFDCNDGDTCPGAFVCRENGACAPTGPGERCASDDACALGEVCLGAAGCASCQEDDDCPGNQTCSPGEGCAEPAGCSDDEDCTGGRVCARGACGAPACDEDDYEVNNTAASASQIRGDAGYRGLASCDDDWFEFELPADTVAEIVVRQLDRDADLTLQVVTADGVELAVSDTGLATEAAVIGPFVTARPVRARIFQRAPYSVGRYDLEIGFLREGACVDDAREAGAGDDTAATGILVRTADEPGFQGDVAGRLCPGDADFVCFYMEAQENLTVSVMVASGNAVVLGDLYNRQGELIEAASGRWSRSGIGDSDIAQRTGRGVHCLRLAAESGSGTYVVRLRAVSRGVESLCDDAEPLALRDGVVTAEGALGNGDETSPTCAAVRADGGEIGYAVTVDDPDSASGECVNTPCVFPPVLLTAQVAGRATGTLGDPVVSVRADCINAGSEVACSIGSLPSDDPLVALPNPAVARAAITEPGTYVVLVDGVASGDDPSYSLQVATAPLAAAPRNDRCEQAEAITLDAMGNTTLTVNLDRARDDVDGCLGPDGPDAIYSLSMPTSGRVRVEIDPITDRLAAGAYLVERCGDVGPIACGFGFDRVVPAGDYFLVVEGIGRNGIGRARATVHVEPAGPAPANETCDTARALDAGGGTIPGDTRPAADDYTLVANNRCTEHDSLGGDVVYRLPAQAGTRYFVQATPTGGWDLSLYATTDCGDPARACVEGSDGALTESIVFTAADTGDVFVIVDGSGDESGAFELRWGLAECGAARDCAAGQACADFRCVAAP